MAKVIYLKSTHDSFRGEEKEIDDQCARVLWLLGKVEYISEKRAGGRRSKKNRTEKD